MLAELARSRRRSRRRSSRPKRQAREAETAGPDELKALVEDYLEELELWPELHGQAESVRYALVEMGGKRVRPVICLATGEALGAEPEHGASGGGRARARAQLLARPRRPAALDDDEERRGKASVWAAYGEGKALLAGDALLAEAFRLACVVPIVRGRARARARRRSG